jgi:hypothetical protein
MRKLAFGISTFVLLSSTTAHAAVISDFTDFLSNTSATQLGRLSRNGLAQDWSGSEAFPGVLNTTTSYHYQTYVINVGGLPFIQVDVDSLSANTFVSAYLTSYAPNSAGTPNLGFDTNWLGDPGGSGNSFGTDPLFFQVIVPKFSNLVIVVNQTSTGTTGLGSGSPFHITVEGFLDSEFTDAPEPSTVGLSCGGLLLMAIAGWRRKSKQVALQPYV